MTTALAPLPTSREPYRFSTEQFRRLVAAGLATPADEPAALAGRIRFTVEQYHHLDGLAILAHDDRVELLDGLLIQRPIMNPPHATAVQRMRKRIEGLVPAGWTVRSQVPITLTTSEPQPDVSVARGTDDDYEARHPEPADLGLVVEVADSSITEDRGVKAPLYAAAGVVEYWIVNINDRRFEVYTQPGPGGYGHEVHYHTGDAAPLALGGVPVGHVAVDDVLR